MSVIARQSTARTVMVGPVLDSTGAAVTGAAIGDLKISKNGGAPASLNGSATLTHRHTGHYSLALTASDLDTVGQAEVVIDKTTDAMPPKVLTVIEEAVYDALFAAGATGLLPANVTQWLSTAPATPATAGRPVVDVRKVYDRGDSTYHDPPENWYLQEIDANGLLSLVSAYDAAKTAAQAGDQMDLVNAPNPTAVTAINPNVYHADIQLTVDDANSQDEYTITWFKNGARVTSGITSPTIQVVKRADGTDLIASTTPTQIGSTGSYKHDESSGRMTAGEAVLAIAGATIDGSARSFAALLSRDSE